MRKHVNEIEHYDIEVVALELAEVAQQFLAGGAVVDFII